MSKRGLSSIVTTVLMILFGVVAVGVLGAVVLNQVSKSGQRVLEQQICTTSSIEPVWCEQDGGMVKIRYKNSGISDDVSRVDNVTVIAEPVSGSSVSGSADSNIGNTGEIKLGYVGNVFGQAKQVLVATTYLTKNNKKVICSSLPQSCSGSLMPTDYIRYWNFNQGSGADSSPYKGDLSTIGAGVTFSNNKVLSNGNGYLISTNVNGLVNNAVSECLWVRINSINNYGVFTDIYVPAGDSRYWYLSPWCNNLPNPPYYYHCIHGGAMNSANNWNGGGMAGTSGTYNGPPYFVNGQWAHVCGVINTSAAKLYFYFNGKNVMDMTTPTGQTMGSALPTQIYVGSDFGQAGTILSGELDEIVLYNHSLSDADIRNIYDSQKGMFP